MKIELNNGEHVEVSHGEAQDLIRWGLGKECVTKHSKKRKASTAVKANESVVGTPAEDPQVAEQLEIQPPDKENE